MNNIQAGSIEYDELMMKTNTWKQLYPIYFDKSVSRANGRKVPTTHAVDTPDVDDIVRVLKHYKLPCILELNKKHPRDFFCLGRVRYNLKDDAGNLINKDIPNKWALYKKLGELIPKLKNRTTKHRTDIVNFKPSRMSMPKGKAKKIKGGKKKRRR